MMTIKEALEKIQAAFLELYGADTLDVRLEEISSLYGDETREITVSFLLPDKNPVTGLAAAIVPAASKRYARLYKKVTFNMTTGEIVAIRIFKE